MKFKIEWSIRISKDGNLHLPLLYLAMGRNGFVLSFTVVCITLNWSELLDNK
jgi:hypothetical protein